MISGAEAEESETGTTAAGDEEGVAADCGAGGCGPVEDCPLFDDWTAFVDVSLVGVGAEDRAVAGAALDCAGAGFCAEDGVADEEVGGGVVPGAASGCAAGVCAGGVGVEPDCGAGGAVP